MNATPKTTATGLTFNAASHRYKLDGRPVTGATTLLNGGVPKPQLKDWYARMVAEYVEVNPLEVERLRGLPAERDSKGREISALVKHLKAVPTRKKEDAALRGTEIHDLGQRYLDGEEVDIPAAHEGEVLGLVDFIEDLQLEPLVVEKSLANRQHWYAGRVDFIGTSPYLHNGDPVLIDWKTSNGVYGETALQCAAYVKADFWVTDDDPATEHPVPDVAGTYVAHIRPGGVELHPLAANQVEIDQHFEEFLAAAYIHKTASRRRKYVGDPVWTPETKHNPAALAA